MIHILLFILIGLGSFVISLYTGLYFEKGSLIQYLSYPNLLIPFLIFVWSIYKLQQGWSLKQLFPSNAISWLCILATTALLLTYEPIEFKIVYDETIQAVTAEVMHFTRTVVLPNEANDHSGSYGFYTTIVEKRPFFFPFVVSLIHDLSGYRYQNGFILNGILTFVLLILINFIGNLAGSKKGGILAVLLAGTMPLFSMMASSAGQEILNLVMLSLAVIFSFLYLKKPHPSRLVPLVYCLILFFQIRYENGIYLLPFGILILIGWQKIKKPILPMPIMVSPLFLILPTIHYFIVSNNPEKYFQAGPNGRENTFSFSYFYENVEAAGDFLFSVGYSQTNSLLISLLGLSACALFLFYYLTLDRRKRTASPIATTFLLFFFGAILHLCVIFLFNFGVFNSYITSRLSMPFHLMLIIICPFVIIRFGRKAVITTLVFSFIACYFIFLNLDPQFLATVGLQFAVAVAAFFGLATWMILRRFSAINGAIIITLAYTAVIAMPIQHSHNYSQLAIANDTVHAELDFIEERPVERFLWISSTPYAPMLKRENCMPIVHMKRDPFYVDDLLKRKDYDAIYIVRRFDRDAEGNLKPMESQDHIDSEIFKLETVLVKKFGTNLRLQFDKLVDIVPPELDPLESPDKSPEIESNSESDLKEQKTE